jgi:hypothetical protein
LRPVFKLCGFKCEDQCDAGNQPRREQKPQQLKAAAPKNGHKKRYTLRIAAATDGEILSQGLLELTSSLRKV